MEDMSEAYLRALCAANGFSITRSTHDNEGWDVIISCKDKVDADSIYFCPKVEVQLKSSYTNISSNPDGSITYKLEVKNYKSLIECNRIIPQILIVFHMLSDEAQWIEHTNDWLKITKCAYWISLKGHPDTTNTSTINVNIPGSNILTKDSLFEIMAKISKNQEL